MDSPWSSKKTLELKDRVSRLSKEILDFESYIAPTKKEKLNRDTLLYSISQLVESLWPNNSKITTFGSSVTGLVFPSSDVDINIDFDVLPKKNKIDVLKIIRKQAISRQIFRWEDSTLAAGAKVPVLMATDENQVSIDISIDNECFSSDRTAAWVKEFPPLKPLFMVLKQAIGNFRVSNHPAFEPMSAKTAGLASYSLICLIVSYLQLKVSDTIDKESPSYYGNLLMGFLSYYSTFDNETTVISLNDGGEYFTIDTCPFPFDKKAGKIAIADPDIPGVNVGRSTMKFDVLKLIFKNAYERLLNKVSSCPKGESILSSILKVEHHYHYDPRRQGSRFKTEKIYIENGAPLKKNAFGRNKFGGKRGGGMPYNKDRARYHERDNDHSFNKKQDTDNRGRGSRYSGGYKSESSNSKSYDREHDMNAKEYRRHKQNNNYHLAEHYKKKHIQSRR